MKHLVGAGLASVLLTLMLSASDFAAVDAPLEIKPLRWAADAEGGAPYVSMDPDRPGKYIGFEVDLIAAIEKEIGRKIEFTQYSFRQIDQGLLRGDFDFAMNGIEDTPDRRNRFRLSRPYYVYSLLLACRRDDDRFQGLDDCKKKGVVVGTLSNTAAARLLEQEGIEKREYDDQATPYKDLEQKQIDAVLLDLPIAAQYPKRDPEFQAKLKFVGKPIAPGRYVVAFRKQDEALAAQFDAAIGKLLDNGTLQRIYERWDLWNDDQAKLRTGDVVEVLKPGPTHWSFAKYFPVLVAGA